MYKAVPPLQEMFNMAGMELPNYLKGKNIPVEEVSKEATAEVVEAVEITETKDNLPTKE
jgi:hypothetical protein